MKPLSFPECNLILKAPDGMQDCISLPVMRNEEGGVFVSLWEPEPMERVDMFRGDGCFWVYVYGDSHPPIALVPAFPPPTRHIKEYEELHGDNG